MNSPLRNQVIRLAHAQPALRPHLLPLLREASDAPEAVASKSAAPGTVLVYEVIYDGAGAGPAGDGTYVYRTRSRKDAEAFAARNTAWGKPTSATATQVPRRLVDRWGI